MLEAIELIKRFPVRDSSAEVHALNGVSLTVARGETLGIVGESGCGKSTLAEVLVRLQQPTSGRVILDGVDLTALRGAELRRQRRKIQLVFQDPYSSLQPRQTIGRTLTEVLRVHRIGATAAARAGRMRELLDQVGLAPGHADRYPHELSGGQRQRVGIARALAVEPSVLLLDEPVSALDVSVRAEVMNLLARLRDELDLGFLFISHDVAMVRQLSDRVAVMYLGRIVEQGPWRPVLDAPIHPYTSGLRGAVPIPDPAIEQPITATVIGEVPNPVDPPAGCTFHPRCPLAEERCAEEEPSLTELAADHAAACHVMARRLIN
ncbi:ABC transporter ATP-binding protein [Microlunatus speluncae]|uniref:ABC transporter ATP-binding protein n=1 Tax=Microlunatus speluncae TaxID=2594267 RepID=UPI001C2D181E|nr:ABC transporter ATP-binding protein [Microlunatus speluncae]